MIKKSIFLALFLFLVYTLALYLKPDMAVTTHQWQGNIIKAENYIYNETDTLDNVIVGTSLACCIIMDSIPSFYNLAFSGLSIYEGLEVIKNKGKLPANIFIETNYFLKEENIEFNENLFSPLYRLLKENILSCREGRQPLAVTGVAIQKIIKKKEQEAHYHKSILSRKETLLQKMMSLKKKEYELTPDKSLLHNYCQRLEKYISYFQKKGVNVILFEMPVHAQLAYLPQAAGMRHALKNHFKQNTYYIEMPDCTQYKTGDGVHVTFEEAKKYTSYFKQEAKKYIH